MVADYAHVQFKDEIKKPLSKKEQQTIDVLKPIFGGETSLDFILLIADYNIKMLSSLSKVKDLRITNADVWEVTKIIDGYFLPRFKIFANAINKGLTQDLDYELRVVLEEFKQNLHIVLEIYKSDKTLDLPFYNLDNVHSHEKLEQFMSSNMYAVINEYVSHNPQIAFLRAENCEQIIGSIEQETINFYMAMYDILEEDLQAKLIKTRHRDAARLQDITTSTINIAKSLVV